MIDALGDCAGQNISGIVFVYILARYGRGEPGHCHLEICYSYLENDSLQPATIVLQGYKSIYLHKCYH